MSEIRQTASSSRAQDAALEQDQPTTPQRAQVPVQVRRDFDAAIRRAGEPSSDDADDGEASEQTLATGGLPPPGFLPCLPPLGGGGGQILGGDLDLLGSHASIALPASDPNPLPDAIPTAMQGSAVGGAQSLRIQVPLGGAEAATLALRLAQTGAGQWQLRMAGDACTRQQLAPHLERLRDRLRERSAGALDDMGFDDDTES